MVKYIICFILSYLLIYLMFSFCEVSFDIVEWSKYSRIYCMLFGSALFTISLLILLDDEKNNK